MRRDLETRPDAVNLQDEQYIRKTADRMQDVVRCCARCAVLSVLGCRWRWTAAERVDAVIPACPMHPTRGDSRLS